MTENNLVERIRNTIRDVPDFPKKGIVFKDITPLLADPKLSGEICQEIIDYWKGQHLDGVIGIESRGFIFGMLLAQQLGVAFIPVRKAGKLPFQTIKHSYDLEYGSAEIEMHVDAISPGQKILIHDDLLATGGTASAAAHLVKKCGGEVAGFSFVVELGFLNGVSQLEGEIHSVIKY